MISVTSARHLKDYLVAIEFNDGVTGVVDLAGVIMKYDAAAELRDPAKFAEFHLDSWPTLVWKCGFDLSPEYLYELLTGSPPAWAGRTLSTVPLVAEGKPRYGPPASDR